MTTFVLHGGATSTESPHNDLFFKQCTELVKKHDIKILMCYWSRPKDQWDTLLARDSQKILEQTSKKVEFNIVESPNDLSRKIASHDVLYVAGGQAELIEPFISELSNLKQSLEGKVYLGSSMGAFIVAKQYVLSFDSQDSDTVHQGIGILPLSILCHWDVEDKKDMKLKLLNNYDSSSPIVTLEETKFTTFYI